MNILTKDLRRLRSFGFLMQSLAYWWVSTPTHQNAEARSDDAKPCNKEDTTQDIRELSTQKKPDVPETS